MFRRVNVLFNGIVREELRKLGVIGNLTGSKQIPVHIRKFTSPIKISFYPLIISVWLCIRLLC